MSCLFRLGSFFKRSPVAATSVGSCCLCVRAPGTSIADRCVDQFPIHQVFHHRVTCCKSHRHLDCPLRHLHHREWQKSPQGRSSHVVYRTYYVFFCVCFVLLLLLPMLLRQVFASTSIGHDVGSLCHGLIVIEALTRADRAAA